MNKQIAIVVCVHGVETYGLDVCKKLNYKYFIANQEAIDKKKRFIDTDLNRCFPGKEDGNHEELIAHNLLKDLKNFNYVIDLHSTPGNCPLFGIITKPNGEKIDLAKKMGLKKLVIMTPHYASGKALIDFVKCGISLEVGDKRKDNVLEVVKAINSISKTIEKEELEIYEVFDIIKGKVSKFLIDNFQSVKKGQVIGIKKDSSKELAQFDFIPVLVSKKSYNDVLCLAAKKL